MREASAFVAFGEHRNRCSSCGSRIRQWRAKRRDWRAFGVCAVCVALAFAERARGHLRRRAA